MVSIKLVEHVQFRPVVLDVRNILSNDIPVLHETYLVRQYGVLQKLEQIFQMLVIHSFLKQVEIIFISQLPIIRLLDNLAQPILQTLHIHCLLYQTLSSQHQCFFVPSQ